MRASPAASPRRSEQAHRRSTLSSAPKPIKVGIIGGSGYSGLELMRLLAAHPQAEVHRITSRAQAGRAVGEVFPSLLGQSELVFAAPSECDLQSCDVIFCAAPAGVAMTHAPALIAAGVKFIDLSADFRLTDVAVWEHWYGLSHQCPQLLAQAVYGLPEMNRDRIRTATLIANPGCYPTAIQLGFLPLLAASLVEPSSLIADAKSGVSGAGRNANLATAFCTVADSFAAYAASGHKHLPEIIAGLRQVGGDAVELVFVPHLLPILRGIHATLYAQLNAVADAMPIAQLNEYFVDYYRTEPFVEVLPPGQHPDTARVRGANYCQLSIHRPPASRMVVVLVVEDNLVKGAAGQAIQNMNLVCGLPETTGLTALALTP